ncbi:hypothetical protein I5S53_07325 [Pseudomonas juntendi]|uniref:phage tail fiber domain-containing protein n=1 Tax=Pseudomonas juntendi TaxID=2666183 RepID=UPI0018D975C4|nr:phage tail fiber protein [Pseudomonas juntendi]MBH3383783.1 hypothetical protein [Pseudomonas juntendi]
MAYTPYSYVQLKADGATTNFPFNFPYLDTAHIQVSVDTVVTAFTWVDSYTIKIASAPTAGGVVEIRRITPKDSAIVSFQDGSTLLEADLDLIVTYNLYCAQEAYDGTQASIHLTADGVWDGQGVRATDFADPVDAQDLMTLNYMNVNFKNTMLSIEQDSIDKTTAIRTAANSDLEAIHTTAVNDLNTITQAAEAATSACQTAAKTSETNAANSAAAASASETASAASQAAAKTSETNAATSEQQAAGYAASLKLPAATGEALQALRQNSTETGLEYFPSHLAHGLGAVVDFRSTTMAAATPADLYGTGTQVGFISGGPAGLAIPGLGDPTYGVLVNHAQWKDSSALTTICQEFSSGTERFFRYATAATTWSGWLTVYNSAHFAIADYLKAGETHDTTGMRFVSANPPAIANITSSGAANALTIGNGSNDYASAVMAFIRDGQYACYLGIDTDNVFKVGGWSMGNVSYPIIHTGNLGAYTGQLAVGAVGTYAFMWANGNYAPGTLLAGSAIYYGSYNYQSSVTASGTWMVCGYLSSGYKATVMLRVA